MIRALVAAVMVGIVSAVVGSFIVLRGMAFLGDALSHAILPGLAIGYLVSGGATDSLFWWALVTAIITSMGIGVISTNSEIKEDTAIGIVFAGMFALGVAMISTVRSYAVDLSHILFGNILGISESGLWLIALFGLLILGTIIAFYKELVVMAFDPVLGTTLRLPTTLLHYLLMVLIAATIVVSLQTVGVALMLAMLITPAATAYLLTRRLPAMMAVGALFGALSGISGLYTSFHAGVASGAAIVLISTLFFLLAFLFAPERGWVWRR
jgi:manganese/iron transport system permease protein